jgi:spermidine synthase
MLHDSAGLEEHVRPYVHDIGHKRSLHFSISAIQSRIDLSCPDVLELGYTRLMMAFLLLQPDPRAIGMVGLGGGSLARFCHHHLPQAHVQVAEINPHVIALRDDFAVPPDGERFQVLQADGAAFVRQGARRFDVLLLDGYHADGLPRSLSTQRFFDHCAHSLLPGGVLVMNLCTDAKRQAQVLARIRRSFGGAALAVGDGGGSNTVVFACNGRGLGTLRPGPLRRPSGLGDAAWAPLQGAFARMLGAWKEEFA